MSETLETKLQPVVEAPGMARAFVRDALQAWRLDGFGEQLAELLVSELVANVVTHVHSPMTLRAELLGEALRIAVDDASYDLPVIMHPDTEDEHGRGMLLIEQVANEWGVEQHPDDGKTVWFSLDVRRSDTAPHRGSSSSSPTGPPDQ